jgi:hypothetical protein
MKCKEHVSNPIRRPWKPWQLGNGEPVAQFIRAYPYLSVTVFAVSDRVIHRQSDWG